MHGRQPRDSKEAFRMARGLRKQARTVQAVNPELARKLRGYAVLMKGRARQMRKKEKDWRGVR